jgi:hypothetical protein
MKTGTLTERTDFSRGYDAGNYGNAYESQDWNAWSAKRKLNGCSHEYRSGAMLGFFSSYEIHEIPMSLQNTIAQLRDKYGEE